VKPARRYSRNNGGASATGSRKSPDGCLFSPEAWECMAADLRLSHRELQIVRQLLDDQKESAIAALLGISAHTIHTHIERLYHKLAVRSRIELSLRILQSFLRVTAAPNSKLPPICSARTAGRCPLAG